MRRGGDGGSSFDKLRMRFDKLRMRFDKLRMRALGRYNYLYYARASIEMMPGVQADGLYRSAHRIINSIGLGHPRSVTSPRADAVASKM
jgi:hypothetical protein